MTHTVPDITIRWRHTPTAPADSRFPVLLARQPDMTLPASADADEIGDQVGARVRELMERHRVHLDIVALVDGDEVMVVDADGDDPDIYGRASIIRSSQPDADRRAAYDLVHAGITAGLPIPMGIYLYRSRALVLDFAPAERGAVDQWAAHLGLPAPGLVGPTYMTGLLALAAVSGWMVNVCCPAATRTESDR